MIQTKLSGGTHWLEPVAAASFERCLAAGAPNAIESAGRTWEAQQALLKRYGYPRAELPARSFHVKGQAIDAQAPLIAWFVAHPEHGWRRTVTAEPWHFQYFPHLDTQEDDMAFSADQLQQIAANGVAQALMGPQSQALIRKIVWDETMVLRGPDVSVKQDLANTGTMARDILEKVEALKAPAAPVIDYDRLATLVAEKMANAPQKTVTIEVQASRKVV